MRLNIAQKIFSIAAVILLLMLIVAGYSVVQTAKVTHELDDIATLALPTSQAAARLHVRVLEQEVLLERLLVLSGDERTEAAEAAGTLERIEAIEAAIERELATLGELLRAEAEEPRTPDGTREAIEVLIRELGDVEREYRDFEAHGGVLREAREAGEETSFPALLTTLASEGDDIEAEIADLHRRVDALTATALARARQEERYLLIANVALSALAAALGLVFALLVTRALVGSVHRLVQGTERIEAGDLDTMVPVTTRDEVGRLTRSFNAMVDGLRLKERIRNTFGKYMDPRIVSNLLDNPRFAEPGGERREMTVMFIDLEGFTSIAEKLAADRLVHTLNLFFGHMTEAIAGHKGVVDKFMGDAVMAFWGPPFTDPDEHAALACRAALGAIGRLDAFRAEVASYLGPRAGIDINLRIGVSTGEMVVGTIGSTASRSFTVIGDPVNLGSRLEGANKAYGSRVLISERTRELAGDAVAAREIDLIRVVGKALPTRVFELTGLADGSPAIPARAGERFQAGLAAYREGNWEAARAAFEACLAARPGDPPSRVYLSRVAQLRGAPPPPDWDGVWVFDSK